ncbi:CpaF family protein [uncultured Bifidobacterium sp.]|uniref:CpaF family protein n=1 Tax=uncultured Bifidobacterium sp. TaxID=165187 RepID=UPI000EC58618|nr:ATPase, T2SS/T4P/T4SS family [uncultured Bifidobacterium sp.]HAH53008.1 pilus assembly protein [Bifidobacterium sp.]
MELGPLSDIASEPGVTDIAVTCDGTVWADCGQGMRARTLRTPFPTAQSIREFAVRLCSQLGRRLDDACPIADASTMEGLRVHAVIAPLVPQGAAISIRLPSAVCPDLAALMRNGMFPETWLPLLKGLVGRRASILVTGGTGAGKTTMLKALLMQCPPAERIITVEEVRELGMIQHANHVSMVTREANMEGVGAIGLSRLIEATLRMRPDRVVVGECRGGEVVDLLRALNSGHSGGMTTLHANQVESVPSRLVALGLLAGLQPQATAALAEGAFDVVLHVERHAGERRITQIGCLETEDGRLRGRALAVWDGHRMRFGRRWDDFMRRWKW